MTPPDNQLPVFVERHAADQWFVLVRVIPGAKRSETSGIQDGRLKIRLSAPAVENKANEALAVFIAKKLALRPSRVSLHSGHTSRLKKLLISTENEPDWQLLLL